MQKPEMLNNNNAIYSIYRYDELDSTNAYIKKNCGNLQNFAVIWAETQAEGRGRFSRTWNSVPGRDLTFSILLPLDQLKPSMWPNITQIAALAVSELLEAYKIISFIKWPNDVLVKSKKICGILCETFKHRSNQ